jgi:predicted CXXCH cytochrome family protein
MRFQRAVGGFGVLVRKFLFIGSLSLVALFPVYALDGDVNFDGVVNGDDLIMLQENWHAGQGNGAYASSQACSLCHREIYKQWKGTLHALLYRDSHDVRANVLPAWSGDVSVSGSGVTVNGTLQMRGEQEYWVVIHFADGDREYRVDRVHGGYPIDENEDPRAPNTAGHSKWIGKQRYQTKIGEGYYILPFQWNPVPSLDNNKQGWVGYHPENWGDVTGNFILDITQNSEERNCAGCHQVGVKPTFDVAANQYQHNAEEPNIGCESCHGPGAKHAASRNPADIIDPEDLADVARQTETCGSCHSRGESVDDLAGLTLEYPYAGGRTYRPGDVLEDLYEFNFPANQWPDGTANRHHQQYEDFLKSKHYEMGVQCWACHDPHGTDNEHDLRYSARDNTLCLRCHDASLADASHTHHAAPADNNNFPRCVDCHMPAVQASGVNFDIHAHTFKVLLPQGTLDNQGTGKGQPNACAICHRTANSATDTDIGVWNSPADITIATYYDGFADTYWGEDPTPTQTPDPVVPTPTPTTVPPPAAYLGVNTCLGCHTNPAIVTDTGPATKWQTSLHSAIYRDPASVAAEFLISEASWTGTIKVSSTVSGTVYTVTATLEIRNTHERWFVVHFEDGDRDYKVGRVHGGHAIPSNADPRDPNRAGGTQWIGKQRYQTKIGDSFYILPFQYNPTPDLDGKRKGWVAYNPNHWTNATGNYVLNLTTRSEDRNCSGCHQQGTNPTLVYNAVVNATQYVANAVAPNIGCENCHGPGGNHLANIGNTTGHRGIILPSMLDSVERRLETCGQCHTRGVSEGTLGGLDLEYPYNGERTYIPGDVLSEFENDEGADWPDGTSLKHHQQYLDFLQSKHWMVARFDCWACHDPHGSDFEHDLKASARDNGLCLQCHPGMDDQSHTHHGAPAFNNENPRCTDCHMAAVQQSGVNYDIHEHTFKVLLPEGTLAYKNVGSGQPNACALCHRTFGGYNDTNAGKWNDPADISIATLLDEQVKQWWPGSLAKKVQASLGFSVKKDQDDNDD